jgi:PAS domain-containing protein
MRICAWCQTEMPSKGEGSGVVTHGICEACAGTLMSDLPISLQHFLDGLPLPVLVVDSDVKASMANLEAQKIIGKPLEEFLQRKGGDVFNCIHAKTPEGCGRTIHCSACAIRTSVTRTHQTGEPQVMVPATLKHGDPDSPSAVALTITTLKRGDLVLLMIHNVER